MKSITADFKGMLQSEVTTLCTCISITRRDKATFCLTDHDQPVVFLGQRFLPFDSFSRLSVSNSSSLEVDGLEILGILNSDAVSREDIGGGLFDFANVSMWLVNYVNPADGGMNLRTGWIGEIESNEDGTFHAEVRGMSQVFTFKRGTPFASECDADLGDSRCKLGLDPHYWKPKYPYRAGQCVLGHISGANHFVNAAITDDDFSSETDGQTSRLATGWVTYGSLDANWHFSSNWQGLTSPPRGGLFAALTDAAGTHDAQNGGMYQDISLSGSGLILADVDTGTCRLVANTWLACITSDSKVQFRIHAIKLDGSMVTIWDSGQHTYALKRWVPITAENILIPANTRTIRVDFFGTKKDTTGWGAAWGGVQVVFNDPIGTYDSDGLSDGVMFQAQNDGFTGNTEPVFTISLGATYTDNQVTWKCITSFKDVTNVTGVTSNQEFAATLPHSATYYDGGILIWETGPNVGRYMEVKTWDGTNITTFQRTFFPVTIGDRFVIHPGCDKRRETCISKFNNLLNFRGFPDVPGQDAYMNSPDYSKISASGSGKKG